MNSLRSALTALRAGRGALRWRRRGSLACYVEPELLQLRVVGKTGAGQLGYVLVIPPFKLYRALVVTLISFVVMGIHSLWEMRRLRTVMVKLRRLGITAAALTAAVAAASFCHQQNLVLGLAVATGSSILFLAILIAMKFFDTLGSQPPKVAQG